MTESLSVQSSEGIGTQRAFWTLSKKIPLYIIGAAFIASVICGSLAIYSAKQEGRKTAGTQLSIEGQAHEKALSEYLGTIRHDLDIVAHMPMTADAVRAFGNAWADLGEDQEPILQKLYITDNPYKTGEKEKLDFANDGSGYSSAHKKYHPWFRKFLYAGGYYDIFMLDLEGNLVYSVFKELDYATNLNTGKWRDSDLGKVFRDALSLEEGNYSFYDFRPYAPSQDLPASFISTPIRENGQKVGVLVFQMPIDRINQMMENLGGLGDTGEALIVGKDRLVRNDTELSGPGNILNRKIDMSSVGKALTGEAGNLIEVSEGEEWLVNYRAMDFENTRWAIVSRIQTKEAFASVDALIREIIIGVAVIILALMVVGYLLARPISSSLTAMNKVMQRLAEGDLSIKVDGQNRRDEIGSMARQVKFFKDNAIEQLRLEQEQALAREKAEQAKTSALTDMADKVETEAKKALGKVTASTRTMTEQSGEMAKLSDQVAENANSVSAAATQALSNAETVAAATEQLTASIGEISQQIAHSTSVTRESVNISNNTQLIISSLSNAVSKISEVAGLIGDIAEQTNLLALNATIEAARAGDSGKGFAVVASEVKGLATQTSRSTEEINRQIMEVQNVTDEAVNAVNQIGGKISEIDSIASAISAAMEEQGSVTLDIARNVQDTASAAREVSSRIEEVSRIAANSETMASSVQGRCDHVYEDVRDLSAVIVDVVRTSTVDARGD